MQKLHNIHSRIMKPDALVKVLSTLRSKGKKIVFTNGCFDLLHAGHIDYLARAASLGDFLVVGLNSDSSVRNIKGPHRPICDEYSRGIVLASLQFVDAVVIFDEDTPFDLISKVRPDILVKGGDYRREEVVGYDIVSGYGGSVVILPFLKGYSTSAIEAKIRSSSH